nr:hypothetical protein [Kibdelosporangium sp. MJ126-NF4]CTQ90868.1 hypothetical protein [Kibdelosporangium sp. MJ126-NF4]
MITSRANAPPRYPDMILPPARRTTREDPPRRPRQGSVKVGRSANRVGAGRGWGGVRGFRLEDGCRA